MAFSWWVTHDNTTVGPLLTTYLFFGNRPAAFMGKIQRAGMSVLSGPVVHGKQQCSISIRDPFNQEPERKKPALLDMASSSISETPSPSSDWCIPWVRDCQWLSNWNILVNFDQKQSEIFQMYSTLYYEHNPVDFWVKLLWGIREVSRWQTCRRNLNGAAWDWCGQKVRPMCQVNDNSHHMILPQVQVTCQRWISLWAYLWEAAQLVACYSHFRRSDSVGTVHDAWRLPVSRILFTYLNTLGI
jgi:hypothetical protein